MKFSYDKRNLWPDDQVWVLFTHTYLVLENLYITPFVSGPDRLLVVLPGATRVMITLLTWVRKRFPLTRSFPDLSEPTAPWHSHLIFIDNKQINNIKSSIAFVGQPMYTHSPSHSQTSGLLSTSLSLDTTFSHYHLPPSNTSPRIWPQLEIKKMNYYRG